MKFKTKLAIYDQFGIKTANTYSVYWDSQYPRISEIIEVEHDFVMLPDSEVVNNQVAIIDNEIEQIKSQAMSSVAKLEQKRQEILAITQFEFFKQNE